MTTEEFAILMHNINGIQESVKRINEIADEVQQKNGFKQLQIEALAFYKSYAHIPDVKRSYYDWKVLHLLEVILSRLEFFSEDLDTENYFWDQKAYYSICQLELKEPQDHELFAAANCAEGRRIRKKEKSPTRAIPYFIKALVALCHVECPNEFNVDETRAGLFLCIDKLKDDYAEKNTHLLLCLNQLLKIKEKVNRVHFRLLRELFYELKCLHLNATKEYLFYDFVGFSLSPSLDKYDFEKTLNQLKFEITLTPDARAKQLHLLLVNVLTFMQAAISSPSFPNAYLQKYLSDPKNIKFLTHIIKPLSLVVESKNRKILPNYKRELTNSIFSKQTLINRGTAKLAKTITPKIA